MSISTRNRARTHTQHPTPPPMSAADLLRPSDWDNYIGQDAMKKRLRVHIASAKARMKPLDHVLLAGPAGMGKTSLAALIAKETGDKLRVIDMPFNEAAYRDLNGFNGVVMLDEIHRGSTKQQEDLLTFLEHGKLTVKDRRPMTFLRLTVIGATTEPQKLIDPLRDRFIIQPHFEEYSDDEMSRIIQGMAARSGTNMSTDTTLELAGACAGVPRRASHLVLAARDMELAYGTAPSAREVLEFCDLTEEGLAPEHIKYMRLLFDVGGPVGLPALVNLMDLSMGQVRDIERLLLKLEYLLPTARGRELTPDGVARAMELTGEDE